MHHSMVYIGKFISNFKEFYSEINTATLTGAIDVIVVEQPDGTFNCSPFHVRFGKLGVLRSREKVVDIEINGEPQDIHMKLGESGEAFFVEELEDDDNDLPEHLATSPIPASTTDNPTANYDDLFVTPPTRRLSFDASTKPAISYDNQINDYTKRRNTTDGSDAKNVRERDFIQRQIGLGNIGHTDKASIEDVTALTAALQKEPKIAMAEENSGRTLDDTITPSTSSTLTATVVSAPPAADNGRAGGKKKRRKTKRKNAPRKSSSGGQLLGENAEKNETTTTADNSSMESNASEIDSKELIQKEELPTASTTTITTVTTTRKIIDPDFHFFSDTELATNVIDSRSNSPVQIELVQSDSEFEVKNRKGENKDNGQSWEWGGFPSVSQTNTPTNENVTNIKTTDQSMISNMFSFMKRNHGQNDGIYLSDLSTVDPEVAALYFSKTKRDPDADMDCESGNGPSLIQSPNSAEGCKSVDSDFDEQIKGNVYTHDITLSLCGWDQEMDSNKFAEHSVTFSDFCNDPSLLDNPQLVVQIQGKYYNWKVAAPIISSLMVFNRPLLQSSIDQLCNMHMPATSATIKSSKQEGKYSWWNWRRSKSPRETTPISNATNKTEEDDEVVALGIDQVDQDTKEQIVETIEGTSVTESLQPPPPLPSTTSQPIECPDTDMLDESVIPTDKCRKTLRLSSKQIASLHLRDGMNEIVFSVTTAYQGTSRCTCHLYKWKWDDKIVISDIDGTITKSDVLGHILPIVGKDWAQSGVAQLFNKIKDNGYKLLYLSARAIGQARITREYLKSIKQGDLTMPDGPILLNPTSLITAFHREVIEKKPEQFKISCMSDIKALFPYDSNPFYAGYGNRINDVWAYRAVGIPIVRIFTINPKGELKHELTQTFQSTYASMTCYVDQLFPPLIDAANDYSQFSYWRDPLPIVNELPDLQ